MALEREMSTPPIPSRSVAQFSIYGGANLHLHRVHFSSSSSLIVYYVTFGILVQIGNIGCLNLFAVIRMVASCGI